MKPTPTQRAVLLSLADNSAQMRPGMGRYRLIYGDGNKVAPSTAASLVGHGWAQVIRVSEPYPKNGNVYILTITPEGLAAVVQYL